MESPITDVTGLLPAQWLSPHAVKTVGLFDEVPSDSVRADATAILDAMAPGSVISVDAAGHQLSADEMAILEFERRWWRRGGAKEQAIRESFAMSPTRYYQALNSLLDLPRALSYDPSLVNRLQRLRGGGQRGRRLA